VSHPPAESILIHYVARGYFGGFTTRYPAELLADEGCVPGMVMYAVPFTGKYCHFY
jgi:hypothetical protein